MHFNALVHLLLTVSVAFTPDVGKTILEIEHVEV